MSSEAMKAMLLVVASGIISAGCSSGTGGSDVGETPEIPPTARAQVLNGSGPNEFREGAEVILTGKASEDGDGPIIDWHWSQIAGPPVRLLEVNSAGVSFTAPAVHEPTELEFELAVKDAGGNTGVTRTTVMVIPGPDTNKFLSLDIRAGSTFDHFKVVAMLGDGADTGATPVPFQISAHAYIAWPPRSTPEADCTLAAWEFADTAPELTASGCHVEMLENLTPAALPDGGSGLVGEWPANVHAPTEGWQERLARPWNPRFTLKIPRVDIREFDQQFIDANRRDQMLEAWAADRLRLVIDVRLIAPENQRDAQLMIASLEDTPVQVLDPLSASASEKLIVENSGAGLPTIAIVPQENLLASIPGRESALTAEVYYRTVDPDGTRTTLNDWLAQAGFTSDFEGTLLPDAAAGTGEFARAVYLNNFDLGFGREMYVRTDEYGNVFSFVNNYVSLENAIRKVDSFVTVVTEFSPLHDHADTTEKFVKFFTYVDDGSGDEVRVGSFDFDGRGERQTPGNCMVCHLGVKPPGVAELIFDTSCGDRHEAECYAWPQFNRDGESIADGNLQSIFLPWDLDSLLFADNDPAILEAPVLFGGRTVASELSRLYGDYSRNSQEPQLKKLNEAAYRTMLSRPRLAPMQHLVEHWYGGVDGNGRLIGTYDDSIPVAGWRAGEILPDPDNPGELLENPPEAEVIYHSVFARHCRACHIALIHDSLRFDDYQKLIARRPFRGLYRTATMPGSRLTMDRYWVPQDGGKPPGEILSEHAAKIAGQPPQPAPGAAHAIFEGFEPAPSRGDTLFLDGWPSQFADSFLWDLSTPPGSGSALVGTQTAHALLAPDVPGEYVIGLTVNPGTDNENRTESVFVVANREPVAPNQLFELNLHTSPILRGSLNGDANDELDADGDALTFSLAGSTATPYAGVTVESSGEFTYAYSGSIANPPDFDVFEYEVADPYGGKSRAKATVVLASAAPGSRPTVPSLIGVEDSSRAAGANSQFSSTVRILAADDDVGVVAYDVYRDGQWLDSITNDGPAGTEFAYEDSTVLPGHSHVYQVAARDGDGPGPLSEKATIRIVTSLRSNILSGWGTGSESLWQVSGCLECHGSDGAAPVLDGPAENVYTALLADQDVPSSRIIDDSNPASSTLLCKPLVAADPLGCRHSPDDVFVRSDPRYRMLADWVFAGAPDN